MKVKDLHKSNTIKDAKDALRAELIEGSHCPVCTRWAQLQKWQMTGRDGKLLIQMYNSKTEYIHIMKKLSPPDGRYARMRFWGLIEARGDVPKGDVKASGFWKITDKGRQFVENRIRVPKKVKVFNNHSYGFIDDESVSIYEVLGKKFSYSELMSNI